MRWPGPLRLSGHHQHCLIAATGPPGKQLRQLPKWAPLSRLSLPRPVSARPPATPSRGPDPTPSAGPPMTPSGGPELPPSAGPSATPSGGPDPTPSPPCSPEFPEFSEPGMPACGGVTIGSREMRRSRSELNISRQFEFSCKKRRTSTSPRPLPASQLCRDC
jgi:hypothetical protein